MAGLNIHLVGPGAYRMQGPMTFAHISQNTLRALKFPAGISPIRLDLAEVSGVDSAGLALLIECIRLTRANGADLQLSNIPPQLMALAKLSGLDGSDYFAPQAASPL